MTIKTYLPILALASALAATAPAHAVSLTGSTLNGNAVSDYSTDGQIAFDLGVNRFSPVTLTFTVGANDGATLALDAWIDNLTGDNLRSIGLSLGGGVSFATLGTASPRFAPGAIVAGQGPQQAAIWLAAPGEGLGVELGDVYGTTVGASDWTLNLNGLGAGQSFTVTVTSAVPEPQSIAMALAGLAVVVRLARRRTSA